MSQILRDSSPFFLVHNLFYQQIFLYYGTYPALYSTHLKGNFDSGKGKIMIDAQYWIRKLNLEEHPEGGYYRETYRSDETVGKNGLPERFGGGPRAFSTAIYFLLKGGQVSRLHRIKSDEIWHYYAGSALTLHVFDPEEGYAGFGLGIDPEKGWFPQIIVPAGSWFGATVDDRSSYTLVGCTVSPGFDFSDFTMGEKSILQQMYPRHKSIIEMLS